MRVIDDRSRDDELLKLGMLLHQLHPPRLERRLGLRRLGLALRDERVELLTRLAGDSLGH